MFTDIEGSTKMLERLRERYAAVLEEHRDLLRATFEAFGGYEVDTQGDSFFVAFPSAVRAAECASQIQRDIAAHSWPDGETLRVRIGLHTGAPTLAATGYVGIDVHRAARVGAAAHGGQVLLSDATWSALDAAGAATQATELGTFRFKGLADPTTVYQLNIDGLPAEFPPITTSAPEDEPPAQGDPPYKGLLRFDEDDAQRFYGREKLVERISRAIRERQFTAIVGASGSGKSSIVRAGVIPVVRLEGWRVSLMTPTLDPVAALDAALHDNDGSKPRMLVLDQLEELFTLCNDADLRQRFVSRLMAWLTPDQHVVVTIRADFYSELGDFPELRSQVSEHQFYIGPMEPDELRRAIEEPARRGGWDIAPGLVDLLLRDVGSEPGALPLLSHALLETWHRRRGSRMTLKGYFESGEVRGAIARTADRLYAELPGDEQALARDILLRLTELGEGTQDTRRRAALRELLPSGQGDVRVHASEVLRQLVDARLVTVDEGAAEVAHEALIREWPKLRDWLHEDREGLRVQRQITDAATEWEALSRESSLLFRGARLAAAREWAEARPNALNDREIDFLEASVAAEEADARERERQQREALEAAQRAAEAERLRAEEQSAAARRLRRRALILVGVVLLAVGLGAAAVGFGLRANDETSRAQAQTVIADDQRAEADRQKTEADTQRATADQQRAIAEQNQKDAEAQRALAEQNEQEANTQRAQAVSRGLAAQSSLLRDNIDLSQLLAVEAVNHADSPQALDALTTAALAEPQLLNLVRVDGRPTALQLSRSGADLFVGSPVGELVRWDTSLGNGKTLKAGEADGPPSEPAFSHDGSRAVIAPLNANEASLWDVNTGEQVSAIVGCGSEGFANVTAWSPDDSTVLVACHDGSALVVDANGISKATIAGPDTWRWASFSADGSVLAGGHISDEAFGNEPVGAISMWDTSDWSELSGAQAISLDDSQHQAVSDDGRFVAYSGPDGTSVWDVRHGSVAFEIPGRYLISDFRQGTGDVVLHNFSAVGGIAPTIWDVEKNQAVLDLAPCPDNAFVGRAVFSRAGTTVAVQCSPNAGSLNGGDDTVLVSDVESGQPIGSELAAHQHFLTNIVFGTGEHDLYVSATDAIEDHGVISHWDLDQASRLSEDPFTTDPEAITTYPSRDGNSIAEYFPDGTVLVEDRHTGGRIGSLQCPAGDGALLDFDRTGSILACSVGETTDVQLWNVRTGELIGTAHADPNVVGPIAGLLLSLDGTRLVVSYRFLGDTDDGDAVVLWDTTTMQPIATLPHDHGGASLDVSGDGSAFATSDGGQVALWSLADGTPISTFDAGNTRYDIAFSGDGKTLAVGGYDNLVRIWDVATGQQLGAPLIGHRAGIYNVEFNSDGATLLSSDTDGTTIVWDVATRQPIAHLSGGDPYWFGADGHSLLVDRRDAYVTWDYSVPNVTLLACGVANRNLTQQEWQQFLGDEPYRQTCPDST